MTSLRATEFRRMTLEPEFRHAWFVEFAHAILGTVIRSAFTFVVCRDEVSGWISQNCQGRSHVFQEGVAFEREDDALMCFMAFR